MKLTIEINVDTAAFKAIPNENNQIMMGIIRRNIEINRILKIITTKLPDGGKLHDINGKTVGHFKLSDKGK